MFFPRYLGFVIKSARCSFIDHIPFYSRCNDCALLKCSCRTKLRPRDAELRSALTFVLAPLGKSVGSSPRTTLKYEIVKEAQSDAEGEE